MTRFHKDKAVRALALEMLGEGFHTAFRKATDCSQVAHGIWVAIKKMPKEDWNAILEFVVDPLLEELDSEHKKLKRRTHANRQALQR